MPKDSNETKLKARITQLQKSLDYAESVIKSDKAHRNQQEKTLGAVIEALTSYPARLPQRQPQGITDGQYAYLLECLRAELGYQVGRLEGILE